MPKWIRRQVLLLLAVLYVVRLYMEEGKQHYVIRLLKI